MKKKMKSNKEINAIQNQPTFSKITIIRLNQCIEKNKKHVYGFPFPFFS